jgi:hypothetical protein
MSHDHAHPQGSNDANTRRLRLTLALVVVYMHVEVVGGLLADSLALIADDGHMLSDAGALPLTLFTLRVARRSPASHAAAKLLIISSGDPRCARQRRDEAREPDVHRLTPTLILRG